MENRSKKNTSNTNLMFKVMIYKKPKIEIAEFAVGVIAVSGPPAIIPNPDVEDVDFEAKSVWDEKDNIWLN